MSNTVAILEKIAVEQSWKDVPSLAIKAATESSPVARTAHKYASGTSAAGDLYFSPSLRTIWLPEFSQSLHTLAKQAAAEHHCQIVTGHEQDQSNVLWIRIKTAANEPPLGLVGHTAGWRPNFFTSALNGPSSLTAVLGSGLLGGTLGYGAGWLGEQILPESNFRRGHLRRTLGLLGAGAGALPALWASHRGWFNKAGAEETIEDICLAEHARLQEGLLKEAIEQLPDIDGIDVFDKSGYQHNGEHDPVIPVDQFNRIVWQDENTPLSIRSATTGLTESASSLRGNLRLVSPADVARIAIGTGSGYLSGLFVGKALGALAGLTPEAQKDLQRAGTWAGLLSSVVPLAFAG